MKHLIVLLMAAMLVACNNQPTNQPNNKPQTTKKQQKKQQKKQLTAVPVNGVDISHHNTVAWDSLKNCDISFVYIKAAEGKTYKDPKRLENYRKAKKHYSVGFYIYWRPDISGKDHYNNFIEATKGCPTDLPPVLDIEKGLVPRDNAKLKKIVKEVEEFTKLYMKDHKVKPIIYTWYEFAIKIHKLNPSYKYWLLISPNIVRNPHKKVYVDSYSRAPWVILQFGKWNFGTGDIDLNYGKLESIKKG